MLIDKQPFQSNVAKVVSEAYNKFRLLIPQQLGTSFPHYIPLEDKEVGGLLLEGCSGKCL